MYMMPKAFRKWRRGAIFVAQLVLSLISTSRLDYFSFANNPFEPAILFSKCLLHITEISCYTIY